MLGWASRLWKANLWFWWYNCFALFVYCVYMFPSTGKRHLGHVWTQLREKNAFLLPHRSLRSNSTTPIVFKTLIIFNISWSRPPSSACSHTNTCFSRFCDCVGRKPHRCSLELRKNLQRTCKATPSVGTAVIIHHFLRLLFFLCRVPWVLILT